jgi:hypothetical protein
MVSPTHTCRTAKYFFACSEALILLSGSRTVQWGLDTALQLKLETTQELCLHYFVRLCLNSSSRYLFPSLILCFLVPSFLSLSSLSRILWQNMSSVTHTHARTRALLCYHRQKLLDLLDHLQRRDDIPGTHSAKEGEKIDILGTSYEGVSKSSRTESLTK